MCGVLTTKQRRHRAFVCEPCRVTFKNSNLTDRNPFYSVVEQRFYLRNRHLKPRDLECDGNNRRCLDSSEPQAIETVNGRVIRVICSACRLQKCFNLGMRSPRRSTNRLESIAKDDCKMNNSMAPFPFISAPLSQELVGLEQLMASLIQSATQYFYAMQNVCYKFDWVFISKGYRDTYFQLPLRHQPMQLPNTYVETALLTATRLSFNTIVKIMTVYVRSLPGAKIIKHKAQAAGIYLLFFQDIANWTFKIDVFCFQMRSTSCAQLSSIITRNHTSWISIGIISTLPFTSSLRRCIFTMKQSICESFYGARGPCQ